jgi:hypothetical protein
MVMPWRMITGVEPDAIKVASSVLNGEDEETGRKTLRLVLTQLPRSRFRQRLMPSVGLLISSLHHSVLSLQEVWRVYSRRNAMTLEEVVVAKLQQLPEQERQQLLVLIDAWIERHRAADTKDVQRAIAAVQSTWATITLDQKTLRWVAEDKELEYELG